MEQFQGGSPDGGNAIKEMPSFIKPAPNSPSAGGSPGSIKKTGGIALDSLEPVIVAGVSASAITSGSGSTQLTVSPNNPSPQNFAASQKGIDLLQVGDILQPRGDPILVGLTKLTYQGGQLSLAQSGSLETCTPEDFQDSFIQKTLNHYYKSDKVNKSAQQSLKLPNDDTKATAAAATATGLHGNASTFDSGDESPERTGKDKRAKAGQPGSTGRRNNNALLLDGSLDSKTNKVCDERKATQMLLQQAKRTPYEFCKVSFIIALPNEMLVEQIQFQLPQQQSSSVSGSGVEQVQQSPSHTTQANNPPSIKKPKGKHNTMNIISNNPSQIGSFESHPNTGIVGADCGTFGANFKILNISTLKSPEQVLPVNTQQSTDSRHHKTSQLYGKGNLTRLQREHRHIAIKSAFSEEVTGKNCIEVNACAVTKHLHITLLCLRSELHQILSHKKQHSFSSSHKSKSSAFDVNNSKNRRQESMKNEQPAKVTGAQKLIAEIEDFDILDEHDQEVAFISKQHYQQQAPPTDEPNAEVVDHEQIVMQLRGEDEEEFERDLYDEDLSNFKVGQIMNNDEDDLRILDSLPQAIKPKNILHNSFQSKKQTSVKQQKGGKGDDQQQNQVSLLLQGPLGRFIDEIVVYGFNTNSIPAITNLTYFMNQAFFMRKSKKYYQAEEVDYLIATLMVTTKRATQAAEFLRRMENSFVKKINRNLTKLEKQGSDVSSHNATFIGENELRIETQNLLIQCAIFELIIADGLSFETQLNEKIQALSRMISFVEGQIPAQMRFAPNVLVSDDSFSALLRILPQLLRFCILCLTHRREIVKMSALKILKFILETQGCSLDLSMIYILKGMFLTFPRTTLTPAQQAQAEKEAAEKLKKQQSSNLEDSPSSKSVSSQKVPEEPESGTIKKDNTIGEKVKILDSDFDLALLVGETEAITTSICDYVFQGQGRSCLINNNQMAESHVMGVESEQSQYATKFSDIKEPVSGFSTALHNVHTHVLETFISVLSSISSHILHRIFYDVIEDALCAMPQESNAKTTSIPKYSASFKQQQASQVNSASMNIGAQTTMKLQAKAQMGQSTQIKVYACKIAEKIITICQGDLNMSPGLLNALVDTYSSPKPLLPVDNTSNQAHAVIKNLWNSIKQKVFPNYSTKGYRRLIEWINDKMINLIQSPKTHSQDLLNTKPVKDRLNAFPDELSDEENVTLCQLCEVITIVTFNRLKQEEEANQLIKLPTPESFGNGASSEMYLLLPQLIFFLEYSIDREDRLQLFTQLYQTIKEVLESVPTNGRSKENQLSVVQMIMPSLRRVNLFLLSHSPSLPMLKYLDIVLGDIQMCAHERKSKQQNLSLSPTQQQQQAQPPQHRQGSPDNSVADPLKLQGFFLDLLENFVVSLSYSLYEEAFTVFDKLLYLTGEAISEQVIKKCIVALVDKYTLKSKSHKASMTAFMKTLMDVKVRRNQSPNISRVQQNTHNNTQRNLSSPGSHEFEDIMNENDLSATQNNNQGTYFEVMAEFCFFENVDTNYKVMNKDGTMRAVDDRQDHNSHGIPQLDFRGPIDMHELFVDKLQFFIDSLALMTEAHIGMFTYLITNHNFKNMLLHLLEHGETHVRMKSHEILEALTSYFVQCCPSKTVYEFPANQNSARDQDNLLQEGTKKMEAEFIAHERLYISQIVIQVAKKSLQQSTDCYLQFNALILLDFLFQNLLPVPTFQNEQVKARKQNRRQTPSAQENTTDVELTMDIEVLSISDMTPELDVMDPAYLRMRMKLVMSLWPHIQAALASPWSNIRSICYGLVCSMLKINVADYPQSVMATEHQALSREIGNQAQAATQSNNLSEIIGDQAALSIDEKNKDQLIMSDILSMNAASQNRLKEIVLPMLYSLLSSKESESKAGGLNILGSFCGLSYDFSTVKINQNLAFLQRNSTFISLPIWRLVYQLQDDWDITIKEASVVLVQLCAPRNAILYYQSLKEKRQQKKIQYLMNQMPNIQSIYVKRGITDQDDEDEKNLKKNVRPESRLKIKNFLVKRNDNAARAYLRFPSDQDLEIILGGKNNNGQNQNQQHLLTQSTKQKGSGVDDDLVQDKNEQSFSIMQESTVINENCFGDGNGNFCDFLAGKVPLQTMFGGSPEMLFSQQAISCQMIEQENIVLAEKVHSFNPDFEDTRFVKNLSRKRQLEIELDMPSRGRQKQKESTLNFFVDTYSDEQIQEIISIFRNDFKPPKNLWIEKQPSPLSLVSGGMSNGALMSQQQQQPMRSQSPDYYQDIYAEAIEQFNQQQAQMQQQQQAQLQQQVQSGSSNSSRESSALSSQGSSTSPQSSPNTSPAGSPVSSSPTQQLQGTSGTGPVLIQAESAQTTAARLSPQPSGRMIDAMEDDQLRKYAEEHQQKQLSAASQSSQHNSSANSQKSSQHLSHHSSQEDQSNIDGSKSNQYSSEGLASIESRNIGIPKDKSGNKGGIWSPDTDIILAANAQANGPHLNAFNSDNPAEMLQHQQQLPYKSESMGLLDAEGYKFLEASDSNSDLEDDQENNEDQRANLIYEMRPPPNIDSANKAKRRAKKQSLKIESLNFDAIQICAQPIQPQQQPRKAASKGNKASYIPKPQLQAVISPQNSHQQNQQQHQQQVLTYKMPLQSQQPQNRIEFYEDPNVEYQGQQQNSSRLGQRSSRLQYQEELKQQQFQREPDEEARYIKTQKLFNKLKSPTDKIAGRSGVNQAFSKGNVGADEGQPIFGRNKSNESRKRKKGHMTSNLVSNAPKPNKSFTKGSKPHHLQLVENDYFSSDDRNVSHLKNLTQKAVHHYQSGLSGGYQWQGTSGKGQGAPGQHSTRHRSKSIGNSNSISTPDFTALQNKLSSKVTGQNSIGRPSQEMLELTSSQELLDQNKISRKMAQTYLSGLSKGFIQNMDNLKLINTCLHQQDPQSTTAPGTNSQVTNNKTASSMLLNKSLGSANPSKSQHQVKKLVNKSFENLGGHGKLKQTNNNGSLLVDLQLQNPKSTVSYQTHRSKGGKNSTLSTSPKRRDGSQTTRMGSSANYPRKQKSIDKGFSQGKKTKQLLHYPHQQSEQKQALAHGSGSSKKGISDLHLFIKTIEKDLTENYKKISDVGSKGPATPNQILRKVEDQMRAFGLDPKSGNNQATAQSLALKFAHSEQAQHHQQSSGNQHSQEKKRKKSMPPKLKLIGLNQAFQGQGLGQDPNSAALYTTSNQNITPSNLSSNGSGSYPFMTKSQKHILGPHFSNSTKKTDGDHYQRSSGSRGRRKRSGNRDRSGESGTSRQRTKSGRLSTGRGASSGSGGRGGAISHQIPHPPMVMTERTSMRPARPATGGKTTQERNHHGHTKNSKSFTTNKVGGSALSKPTHKATSLNKLNKNHQHNNAGAFSPPQTQSQLQNAQGSKGFKTTKLGGKHHSKDNKQQTTSLSAMNHQIATGKQADQQLLQQLLNGTGGSISVRNSDYNSQFRNGVGHQKGNSQQLQNPFLLGKNSTQKINPGSTKGSQTNRFQNNLQNNILFELLQNQGSGGAAAEGQPPQQKNSSNQNQSKKSAAQRETQVRQSGSQSSRVPHTTSGQPIKMIKNKKLQQNTQSHQYD